MKILVAVKRVLDYNAKARVNANGTEVDLSNLKMSINPFDENAVEEALRLKEKGLASEVVAVSIGTAASQDVLRHALAMGADRAILVESEDKMQSLHVAKLLQAVALREQPALIILGKQAIDDDAGQTGQMLAALLGCGQGTFASALAVDAGHVTVTREVDGGTETLVLGLPAVVTADLRLNDPRFVKLPNLMMAKKKPLESIPAAELGASPSLALQTLQVAEPPVRTAGVQVASVTELVAQLRAANVI